ncbi:hypothetical protein GGS26DRAFT_591313 [Hypomontagnella submonticulosa]|nr:hypothetical protein GGS26DRAFT_591313 [Hypomontagnella submonticulosa]
MDSIDIPTATHLSAAAASFAFAFSILMHSVSKHWLSAVLYQLFRAEYRAQAPPTFYPPPHAPTSCKLETGSQRTG